MTTRTLNVSTYDDLLESLPQSGIFDMTDCSVAIWCPESAETEEVGRMVTLIESMIHVTDVKIGSSVEDFFASEYRIEITQEKVGRLQARRRSAREKDENDN